MAVTRNPSTPVERQTHPILPPNPTLPFVNQNDALSSPALQFLQQLYASVSTLTVSGLSDLFDNQFGDEQGSIVYRGEDGWTALPPGEDGFILVTNGPDENPEWVDPATVSYDVGVGLELTSATRSAQPSIIQLIVPVDIAHGGTGATEPVPALANLGGAPLDSPFFTGDPRAPTPPLGDSDNSLATTEFVHTAIDSATSATTVSDTPPADPEIGEFWWDTITGQLYVWYDDGTSSQWVAASNQPGPPGPPGPPSTTPGVPGPPGRFSIGSSPPPFPVAGDGWWDSDTGQLYLWYEDGTSEQWVAASNQPGPPGPPGPEGVDGPQGIPGPLTITSDTPPLSPQDGELWYDSTSGELFIFYDDGTSSQWVIAHNQPGPPGPVGPPGSGVAGFTEGSISFADPAGFLIEDNANLFFDNTNNRLGIGTSSPEAALHIGKTAGTARVYNTWTNSANSSWAYLGDWDKSANVATYGTDKIGTGVAYPMVLVAGGTEYLRINPGGLITFTGTTSSFPALKQLDAVLQVKLADDSSYGIIEAVTAPPGTSTNQLATTEFVVAGDNFLQGQIDDIAGGGGIGTITGVLAGAGLTGGGTAGGVTLALIVSVDISFGGTGATTAPDALSNLGAAPLNSPIFTGNPQAPTPLSGDHDQSIATTEFVNTALIDAGFGSAFTPGSVIFAGATGVITEDNPHLFWDDTNNRLGIGTITPEEALHVTGAIRFPGGIINTAGELGIQTTPPPSIGTGWGPDTLDAAFRIGGIYDTATAPVIANIQNIFRSSAVYGTHNLFAVIPYVEPRTAAPVAITAVCSVPNINNSAVNITAFQGVISALNVLPTYTGTLTTVNLMAVGTVSNTSGGPAITNVRGLLINQQNVNNNLATGTVNIDNLWLNGIVTSSAGGIVNNNSARIIVPAGGASSGSAVNRGILLTGNGGIATGTGTVTNHAIWNNSTADVYLSQGKVGIKTAAPQVDLHVGTTAGTARVYNSFPSVANNEWAYIGDWGKRADVATYGTDKAGTGIVRNIQFLIGGVDQLNYGVTVPGQWRFSSVISVSLAGPTQAYFGSTGANNAGVTIDSNTAGNQAIASFREANLTKWQIGKQSDNSWFQYDAVNAFSYLLVSLAGTLTLGESSQLVIPKTGLVGFSGATSAFPALKRSAAELQVRLADDSQFAYISAFTAPPGTSNNQLATTAFVNAAIGGVGTITFPLSVALGGTGATDPAGARFNLGAAPLASPAFTGNPTSLATLAPEDSDTSLATTAFVHAAIDASSGGGGDVSISDTAPTSPTVGDMWWDGVSGQLFVWVDDGTSTQWVISTNQPGPTGPTGPQGPQGDPGNPGLPGQNWIVGSGLTLDTTTDPDTISLTEPSIPEAPLTGFTYGRQSSDWTQVIMVNGDVVDGGNF